MSNWAYNLDMLAQNGVLDFDGASYIMGQNPRYVGSPLQPPSPYVGQVPNAPAINNPPKVDEFKPTQTDNKNPVKNPPWKKILFAAVSVGALVMGICKFKTIKNWVTKNLKWKPIKKFIVDKSKAVGNFFKKGWNKFIGLFRSKKP